MPLPILDERLWTGSETARAVACPPSVVLPSTPPAAADMQWADEGEAKHTYLQLIGEQLAALDMADMDAEQRAALIEDEAGAALAQVPEEYRDDCEVIRLEYLPLGPGFEQEVSIAVDLQAGTARLLGRGIRRRYGAIKPTEVALTMDVARVQGRRGYVGEYKTGMSQQEPAPGHWQLRMEALALAWLHDLEEVDAALIQVFGSGSSAEDAATWSRLDVEFFAAELQVLALETIPRLREAYAAGATLPTKPGRHCKYCPAVPSCPSKVGLMRAAALRPDDVLAKFRALLGEDASRAYQMARAVHDIAGRMLSEAHEYARTVAPIQMDRGMVYGPVTRQRATLDGAATYRVVERLLGREAADVAVEMSATKASVERAVKHAKSQGLQMTTSSGPAPIKAVAPIVRQLLDALDGIGGVAMKDVVKVEEHAPQITAGAEAPHPVAGVQAPDQQEAEAV